VRSIAQYLHKTISGARHHPYTLDPLPITDKDEKQKTKEKDRYKAESTVAAVCCAKSRSRNHHVPKVPVLSEASQSLDGLDNGTPCQQSLTITMASDQTEFLKLIRLPIGIKYPLHDKKRKVDFQLQSRK
jgi:hypothetical protein